MFKDEELNPSNLRNYRYARLSSSDSTCGNSNEIGDSLELQNRKTEQTGKSSSHSSQEYDTLIDRPILKGESLTSISLKYRIPVAVLKRVNRLQKETEFYALNSLKIPVKFNSALHEILQKDVLTERKISVGSMNSISNGREVESEMEMPVGVISISQILREKKTREEARKFLENMQNDLSNLQQKTSSYKGSLDEVAASLTDISFTPIEQKVSGCSGADWDIAWWKLLLIAGIVIIGVPCIYLFIYS